MIQILETIYNFHYLQNCKEIVVLQRMLSDSSSGLLIAEQECIECILMIFVGQRIYIIYWGSLKLSLYNVIDIHYHVVI